MQLLLIIFIIVLYTAQTLFLKLYTSNYPGDSQNTTPVFAIVCGLVTGALAFVFSGCSFHFSCETLLFGIVNAAVLYAYDLSFIKASGSGPYSIQSSILVASGIVIPPLYSLVCFGDRLGWIRLLSIIPIVGCSLLVVHKPSDSDKHKSITMGFILSCLAMALFNGIYAIVWDLQQRWDLSEEREELVALTFLGTAVIAIIHMFSQKTTHFSKVFGQTKRSLIYLLLGSFVSGLAILGIVFVLEFVNVTILYTLQNAGILILSLIASVLLLKEKVSRINIIGCVGLCVMMVIFSLADHIETLFA